MNTVSCITALVIASLSVKATDSIKLSDRFQDGELQRMFCAAQDGDRLIQIIVDQEIPPNFFFASITEAKQSRPPYVATDPKYNTDPPKRPQHTSFKLKLNYSTTNANQIVPESMELNDLVPAGAWHGPHYTAYQGLIEAGFDPFAHNGEVAFRFDGSKQGRERFMGLLIVPNGWGSQVGSAASWRLENKHLFEKRLLTQEEVELLRLSVQSSNSIIKKMSVRLLMQHKAASTDDMKAWLRSEASLADTAVTVQLMLAQDAKNSVVAEPAWMLAEGERMWGGALIGATLMFAQNDSAVTSMMHYHAKLREAKQVPSDEINALKNSAKGQIGYDTIEAIGAELIRTNMLRNYPVFSGANQMLSATNIIDRASLFFEAAASRK